jgi:hypothetical protein
MYVVAIPSYNRPKELVEKTLTILHKYGIHPKRITIFVADEEQHRLYKDVIPKSLYGAMVVGVKGLANVRNFISDYYPLKTHIFHIDDDISKFEILVNGKLVELKDLSGVIKEGFELCEKLKYHLWGFAPVRNAFFMKDDISTDLKFIIGNCFGFINRRIKVHSDFKDDYERTLENAIRDGGVVRFNNVVAKTKIGSKGGLDKTLAERAKEKKHLEFIEYLKDEYKGLVRDNPRRRGEILLSRTIDSYSGGKKDAIYDASEYEVSNVPIRNKEAYCAAKQYFLEEVSKRTIPKIRQNRITKEGKIIRERGNVIGTIGRTTTFGYGRSRSGWVQFRANKEYPMILDALIEVGRNVVPKGFFFNAITLNDGVKAKKHIDGVNVGKSVIVGIGDYTGGKLRVYEPDGVDYIAYDVKNAPKMFNGSLLPHETESFKGQRYTIIYYKHHPTHHIEGYRGKTKGI